jgi:hypothetical protein
MKKLGLINYEGDCLRAVKINNYQVEIQDQYGETCATLMIDELYAFIDGDFDITDSQGKQWNYPKEHKDAKPSHSKVYQFVKDLRYTEREVNDAFVMGWELRHQGLSDELIIHEFVGFLNGIAEEREKRKGLS